VPGENWAAMRSRADSATRSPPKRLGMRKRRAMALPLLSKAKELRWSCTPARADDTDDPGAAILESVHPRAGGPR